MVPANLWTETSPKCVLWGRGLPDAMANFSCPTSRHTNFHWRFGIPNCAAANVTISNRGGIQGLEVQLAAAPRTEADAAALRLVVECGLWDSSWATHSASNSNRQRTQICLVAGAALSAEQTVVVALATALSLTNSNPAAGCAPCWRGSVHVSAHLGGPLRSQPAT